MKKLILVLSIISMFFILSCTQNNPVACTQDAKICPDGSAVGRTGPNCEFVPCPQVNTAKCDYNDVSKSYLNQEPNCVINFMCTKDKEAFRDECGCGCKLRETANTSTTPNQNESLKQNYCTAEQRQGEMCIELYQPVCGWFNPARVQCIKYPCAQEFSNSCFACHDDKVVYWTEGACPK